MTEALTHHQKVIGVTPDGAFGPNTARATRDHYSLPNEAAAHLLGQCYHESAGFTVTEENLNYSAEAMMRVWPSRYPDAASTEGLARNPEALANHTYGGRMGNTAAGDGWKYRGRGFIQLTGRNNYTAFSKAIQRPNIIADPDPVAKEYAFLAALWFFQVNGLVGVAAGGVNDETIRTITKRVNGGTNGLHERSEWTKKIYGWLSS